MRVSHLAALLSVASSPVIGCDTPYESSTLSSALAAEDVQFEQLPGLIQTQPFEAIAPRPQLPEPMPLPPFPRVRPLPPLPPFTPIPRIPPDAFSEFCERAEECGSLSTTTAAQCTSRFRGCAADLASEPRQDLEYDVYECLANDACVDLTGCFWQLPSCWSSGALPFVRGARLQ